MKKITFLMLLLLFISNIKAQIVTTNVNAVGLEHNVLFNANSRYLVTQDENGPQLDLEKLFDGKLYAQYPATPPSLSEPAVILIESLPPVHRQSGAWVGWTTRYWGAKKFKIEGYNSWEGATIGWVTLADYSTTDYTNNSFKTTLSAAGAYSKLRFTFYEGTGINGRFGLTELFYLHPEAMTPYEGLLDAFAYNGNDIVASNTGNVGIGTSTPGKKLEVNGDIIINDADGSHSHIQLGPELHDAIISDNLEDKHYGGGYFFRVTPDPAYTSADYLDVMMLDDKGNVGIRTRNTEGYQLAVEGNEGIIAEKVTVKVRENWADYVFEENYKLPSLEETERYIQEKGHLQNIPSATLVAKEGVELGAINVKLLEKIEELTLYTIQQNKEIKALKEQQKEVEELKVLVKKLLEDK